MPNSDIFFYERGSSDRRRETVLGEGWLKWAYQSPTAGPLRGLAFRSRLPSQLLGAWFDSPLSRPKIARVIKELEIDVDEFRDPMDSFATFNAFFTRCLKPEARPWSDDPDVLVSPADGRTLVYPALDKEEVVPVKGCRYSVSQLLKREAAEFHGGALVIVRLCPADYHRFHYPCAGTIVDNRILSGNYHSVNPIALALGINVFAENKRQYSIVETERFGRMAVVEVGAFGVGGIEWTNVNGHVNKMDERGAFKFGGSTLILIFEPGKVQLSQDLISHSADGYETLVKVGDEIGRSL